MYITVNWVHNTQCQFFLSSHYFVKFLIFKHYVQNGGDIGRQHPSMGNTVLHVACVRGHYSIFNYLIQFTKSGPEIGSKSNSRVINVNAVNADGKTALELAAEKGECAVYCCDFVKFVVRFSSTTGIYMYMIELFNHFQYLSRNLLFLRHTFIAFYSFISFRLQ